MYLLCIIQQLYKKFGLSKTELKTQKELSIGLDFIAGQMPSSVTTSVLSCIT